jgi:hypothetical protein
VATLTIDVAVVLGAFGAVVTALVFMYKSYDKRLSDSIQQCQLENAKHEETINLLNLKIEELTKKMIELSYQVGFSTGKGKALDDNGCSFARKRDAILSPKVKSVKKQGSN